MGLDIVVRTDIGLTVASSACRTCDLKLTARSGSGQHDLRILQTILRHQRLKLGGILRRDAHTAVRGWLAEILHLITAVDGVTVLYKEN